MNQAGIEKLYKSYKKDARKILFKEGKSELEIIISSLAQICNVDAEEMNYESLKTLCDIYVDTFVRKAARQEDVDIILDMPKKHSTYVKDTNDASKIMAFLVLHSENSKYKYVEDENFLDLVHTYLDSFKFMKENEGLENKYLKDDEYGLVETKPIYTHGQMGTELYFSTLMGKKDEELIYEYQDSLTVDGINGFVDVYSLKQENGTEVEKIYINRYGNKNSNNAPKGFKIKKINIEKALDKSEENVRKKLTKEARFELVCLLVSAVVAIYLLFFKK